ncbi:MAG: hypothetical protein ACOC8N_00765 [Spirochaetota bacterium]
MLRIQPVNDHEFEVTVEESGASTRHVVTVDDAYHRRLTGGRMSKQDLVKKSFEFLLARESKESILRKFHLKEISRYFPDYEDQVSL